MDSDELYMKEALKEAQLALAADEVPIGAVVVAGGRIIGRGHNMTESLTDITAHAEMIAITAALQYLGGKYLVDATLYVTVEPCLMCAGAIGWSQIRRIVIGAPDPKRGYTTYTSRSPFHPKATLLTGVLASDCSTLLKTFFASKRR